MIVFVFFHNRPSSFFFLTLAFAKQRKFIKKSPKTKFPSSHPNFIYHLHHPSHLIVINIIASRYNRIEAGRMERHL